MVMGRPVVHFEIIGRHPAGLRRYYGELFGWTFETGDASHDEVSEPGQYGFIDGAGINGGIGGGDAHTAKVLFYVGVADVDAALREAERLGGTRELGPEGTAGELVIGRFTDPEGNLIGVAGVR